MIGMLLSAMLVIAIVMVSKMTVDMKYTDKSGIVTQIELNTMHCAFILVVLDVLLSLLIR